MDCHRCHRRAHTVKVSRLLSSSSTGGCSLWPRTSTCLRRARIELPSPIELPGRARLRYVATFLHSGHDQDWGLLAEDLQWISLIEEDMSWIWQQLYHASHLQDPQVHWQQWETLILHHYTYWRKLVRRACEHTILQRRNHSHLVELSKEMITLLRGFYDYDHLQHQRIFEPARTFGCLQCHKLLEQGWRSCAHVSYSWSSRRPSQLSGHDSMSSLLSLS